MKQKKQNNSFSPEKFIPPLPKPSNSKDQDIFIKRKEIIDEFIKNLSKKYSCISSRSQSDLTKNNNSPKKKENTSKERIIDLKGIDQQKNFNDLNPKNKKTKKEVIIPKFNEIQNFLDSFENVKNEDSIEKRKKIEGSLNQEDYKINKTDFYYNRASR